MIIGAAVAAANMEKNTKADIWVKKLQYKMINSRN